MNTMQPRILGIIPARGTNDEIDHLNIKHLGGKPMIAYSVAAALKSRYISRLIVSTEDRKIAGIARACGAEVPFCRPLSLCAPGVVVAQVVRHALDRLKEKYDIVAVLLPNSPFRTAEDIDGAIRLLIDKKYDLVLSCMEDNGFFWKKKSQNISRLGYKGVSGENPKTLFKIAGGMEICRVRNYRGKYPYTGRIGQYVMKDHTARTVNSLYDLLIAERLIRLPADLVEGLVKTQ